MEIGPLATKKLEDQGGDDPFHTEIIHVNMLTFWCLIEAFCCLIEPIVRDIDGSMIRSLPRPARFDIKKKCYRSEVLTTLKENRRSGQTRNLLNINKLFLLLQLVISTEFCASDLHYHRVIDTSRVIFFTTFPQLIFGLIVLVVEESNLTRT